MWTALTEDNALLRAFWVTIQLTLYSGALAMLMGTALAAMRVGPIPAMRWFASAYVTLIRNTPLTLLVLICSIGLYQNLGIALAPRGPDFIESNNFWLAVLGFTLYTAAFVCETLRAGINTVPLGQAEAARALGLPFIEVLRLIVLPQAIRAVIVPSGSVLIALTKNTTIASVIGVAEASLLMKETIENHADQMVAIFGVFALGFVVLTLPIGFAFGALDRKFAVK